MERIRFIINYKSNTLLDQTSTCLNTETIWNYGVISKQIYNSSRVLCKNQLEPLAFDVTATIYGQFKMVSLYWFCDKTISVDCMIVTMVKINIEIVFHFILVNYYLPTVIWYKGFFLMNCFNNNIFNFFFYSFK